MVVRRTCEQFIMKNNQHHHHHDDYYILNTRLEEAGKEIKWERDRAQTCFSPIRSAQSLGPHSIPQFSDSLSLPSGRDLRFFTALCDGGQSQVQNHRKRLTVVVRINGKMEKKKNGEVEQC